MSSLMNFPIHDYPSDYWRFTPAAFEVLLKKFEKHEVEFDGNPAFPEGIYGFGIKRHHMGCLVSFVRRTKSLKKRFSYSLLKASSILLSLTACASLRHRVLFPILVNALVLW